jgi:hypothetical protein
MLPVTSDVSSEIRQAATPTHTVSVRAITSRSTEENWLTSYSATYLDSKETSTLG